MVGVVLDSEFSPPSRARTDYIVFAVFGNGRLESEYYVR
jgi:hypothetical protein